MQTKTDKEKVAINHHAILNTQFLLQNLQKKIDAHISHQAPETKKNKQTLQTIRQTLTSKKKKKTQFITKNFNSYKQHTNKRHRSHQIKQVAIAIQKI